MFYLLEYKKTRMYMCLFLINMIRHLLFLLSLTHVRWEAVICFIFETNNMMKNASIYCIKIYLVYVFNDKISFFLIPFLIHMQTQLFCTCFESLYIFFSCRNIRSLIITTTTTFFVYFMQTPCGSLQVRYRHV